MGIIERKKLYLKSKGNKCNVTDKYNSLVGEYTDKKEAIIKLGLYKKNPKDKYYFSKVLMVEDIQSLIENYIDLETVEHYSYDAAVAIFNELVQKH